MAVEAVMKKEAVEFVIKPRNHVLAYGGSFQISFFVYIRLYNLIYGLDGSVTSSL